MDAAFYSPASALAQPMSAPPISPFYYSSNSFIQQSFSSYVLANNTFNADANNTFDACWMEAISGGMQWATLVGCFLIFYAYMLSRGEVLWNVLVST
jgi:hypothetical protein